MTAEEYCGAFCEGYFYAQLGERLTNGKVTEQREYWTWQRKRLKPV